MTQRPPLSINDTFDLILRLAGGAILGVVLGATIWLITQGLWLIAIFVVVGFALFVGLHLAGDWLMTRIFRLFGARFDGIKPARNPKPRAWLVAYATWIALPVSGAVTITYLSLIGAFE